MEMISKYPGAVFFVDMLGFSALTNGQIQLEDSDFDPWLRNYHVEYNNQFLAASLLSKFRELLNELDGKYEGVTIAQLSDCAFVWSRKLSDILMFVSNFMWNATSAGLLCRGGMSYGEIIETNQNHKLGRFIVGKAVTEAVKLEGRHKGARVLMSQCVPVELWEENKSLAEKIVPLFQPFTNPLDYEVYDEFKWYLVNRLTSDCVNYSIASDEVKLGFTKNRLKLANFVRASPIFYWNVRNKEGAIHIKSTISFLSENKLLDIYHNFEWTTQIEPRSEGRMKNINLEIEKNENYCRYTTNEPPFEED